MAEMRIDALRERVAELEAALKGVVDSRDRMCLDREKYNISDMGNYWSPHASMVESKYIADAREALQPTGVKIE